MAVKHPSTCLPRIDIKGNMSSFSFFFDIDGTLVDIADNPTLISADPWLRNVIRRLFNATGGALALISGRSIMEVDRLFSPICLPTAGQHGAERRDAAGRMHYTGCGAKKLDELRKCVFEWAAKFPELLIEDKGMSIAVHYRQAPHLIAEVQRGLRECLGGQNDLFQLQKGKMVFEIKPTGKDKGTAISEFMNEPPFHGRIPVFVGDDVTDEYGFIVVNSLHGYSIKVGLESSAAGWCVPDVKSVRAWLEEVLDGLHPAGESI
jgi:trehalose 6-phosphate phosphatase